MSMYGNRKGAPPPPCPSDAQAREKLALYVYEYLHHTGAKQAAETFLKEINWSKNITLGEPPGFLHSWWCVFWDLYCAAPERRDSCDSSQEAKGFHDYGFVGNAFPPQVNGLHGQPNATPSPIGIPGGGPDGMAPGHPQMQPGHPFFGGAGVRPSPPHPNASQSSPHHPPGSFPPRPGFPPGPGGPRMPGVRMSQSGEMPGGFGSPGVAFPGPPQRLPPSTGPPPHPRIQPQPINQNFGNIRGPRPGGPGAPWPPSTSAGGMMNGPGAMPSPQNMPPGSEGERYMGGGPGSVEQGSSTPADGMNGAEGHQEMKNSPASTHGLNGGTPGPGGNGSRAGSVGGPGSVPSSGPGPTGGGDSMEFTQSGQGSGFPPMGEHFAEQSEIAKIKERMMEETKHLEQGSGPAGDEFF